MTENTKAAELKSAALDLKIFDKYREPAFYVDEEVRFLQEVERNPVLYEDKVIRWSIQRYESYWLPFVAANPGKELWVPLDIHWIWHCHLLAPRLYVADCMKLFGVILDKKISTSNYAKERTLSLWKEKYPDEKLDIDLQDIEKCAILTNIFSSTLSYDLHPAVNRQKVFNYQVSLPHFTDDTFIKGAVNRYKMFLMLKSLHPDKFFVPCYDMDVVWHTHMQFPVLYKKETEMIMNEHFNHDDSVNDRTPGSKLDVSGTETKQLWRKTYDEDYFSFGSLFRGDPPTGKLNDLSGNPVLKACRKIYKIRPTHMTLQKKGKFVKNIKDISLSFYNTSFWGEAFAFVKVSTGDGQRWVTSDVDTNTYRDNSKQECRLTIYKHRNLYKKLLKSSSIFTEYIYFENMFDDVDENEKFKFKTFRQTLPDGTELNVEMEITFVCRNSYLFSVKSANDETLPWPTENAEGVFGPVPIARMKMGKVLSVSDCRVSGTIDNMNANIFICRVIHSVHLMASIIQVKTCNEGILGCPDDTLLVVAHNIGLNELPSTSQVDPNNSKCIALDPKKGERAMIIKNNAGDWAVLKGYWTGVKKPVKPPFYRRGKGKPGDPGYLQLKIHFNGSMRTKELVIKSPNFITDFGKVQVDYSKGHVTCDLNESNEVAEYIVLAFSTAMLHCYCQPYPPDFLNNNHFAFLNYEKKPNVLKSSSATLLKAAGLLNFKTPTNNYLKDKIQKKINRKRKPDRIRPRRNPITQMYGLYSYDYYLYESSDDDDDDNDDDDDEAEKENKGIAEETDIDRTEDGSELDDKYHEDILSEDTNNSESKQDDFGGFYNDDFAKSLTDTFGGIISQSDVDFGGGYEPFSSFGDNGGGDLSGGGGGSSNYTASDSFWTSNADTSTGGCGGCSGCVSSYSGGGYSDYGSSSFGGGGFSSSCGGGGGGGGGGCGGGGCGGGGGYDD